MNNVLSPVFYKGKPLSIGKEKQHAMTPTQAANAFNALHHTFGISGNHIEPRHVALRDGKWVRA